MKRPATVFIVLSLVLVFSLPALALTGSGVSPVTPLETVSPVVQSAAALTERSLSVTFSEPLLAPGGTTPGNYTVSGPGLGTLSAVPDTVTGSGPHTLTWTAGEMRNGAAVTVSVSGVQDAVGNPLLPASATASASGMGVAPVFTALLVTPSSASEGDTVTITFTASEPLNGDPVVTVNGHAAAWVSGAKGVDFSYTYTVGAGDAPGMASLSVAAVDLAGNLGSFESLAALEITGDTAGLPVRAWPLALLLGGIMVLVARRGMTGVLCGNVDGPSGRVLPGSVPNVLATKKSPWRFFVFLAAVLAAQTAFAAPPAVSGVSMRQQDNGAGGTEAVITYDLDAPNGPCDITVSLSKDRGADGYVFPVTSVTGDVSGVAGGAGKQIVWDIRADYPEEALPNARVRVTVDDGLAQHTLTYTAGANGTVWGPASQAVQDGGSGLPILAHPDTGHHFVSWSDGRTDNPRTDINITADVTVTAVFAINTYTLTYMAGGNGSVTGVSPQTVNHGTDGTPVTAVPDAGCNFVQWSDGVLTAARQDSNVTADITVMASFVVPPPVVTSFAVNSGAATTDTLAVTLNNTAMNSPVEYMASEAGDFSGATWQAYGAAPSFALSGGAGGVKTVYFKVRNAALVESAVVSDTIDLAGRMVLLPGDVPLELVWVPSGSFLMGRYPGEEDSEVGEDPQHDVTLVYGFWMGKCAVTQQQWIAVRSTWPGTAPSAANGLGNTYPAYYISWDDTKNFITSLNAHIVSSGQGPLTVRLPSEAEWEYACRAGTQTRFYWGDDISYAQIGTYAWYTGNNSPNGSKAVGGKTGNAFGLFDMGGNVWEWCEDDYHGSYTGAPTDGSAWIDSPRFWGRMIRGGGWNSTAWDCRSACRGYAAPGARLNYFGFRLAAVQ